MNAAAVVVLPVVWATAADDNKISPPAKKPLARVVPEFAFYRKYTEALLRRYMKLSMEAGRALSLLGREMFRGKVTHYRVQGFDDVVIFVHDVESCLKHIIGDSIACSWNGSQCSDSYSWSSQLTLLNQPTYTRTNWGIYGATIRGIEGSEANRVARRCTTDSGQAVALLDAGINDLLSATTSQTFQSLTGEIQTLKRTGCKVFVGTMISSTGSSSAAGAPTMDAQKNAYDGLILQQARSVGADGIIDFAANPQLGADGANTNTNFLSDHTHPSAAGQQLMAAAASNALNYYYGYNEMNPHTVTALPYSMTAADGAVSLSGVTGAGNLTLPDCTGQSGAVYRISNPQSAYAITVSPLNANQLINGIAFGTMVAVPANGTLVLRDVPNPKTVSGCHWEM